MLDLAPQIIGVLGPRRERLYANRVALAYYGVTLEEWRQRSFGPEVHPEDFDRVRLGKAPIDTPRRAMGDLLGNAVRFGVADDVLAAGEGIETMLSLRCAMSTLPMAAALSANHLGAIDFPLSLRRLYIARDADAAGDTVVAVLTQRAKEAGIEAIALSPRLGDFNEDLHIFGLDALRAALWIQLVPEDVDRFLPSPTSAA